MECIFPVGVCVGNLQCVESRGQYRAKCGEISDLTVIALIMDCRSLYALYIRLWLLLHGNGRVCLSSRLILGNDDRVCCAFDWAFLGDRERTPFEDVLFDVILDLFLNFIKFLELLDIIRVELVGRLPFERLRDYLFSFGLILL